MPTGVYKRKSIKSRLFDRVERIPESGCWIWMGYIAKNGYGQIGIGYKLDLTHRVSYVLHKGEIPKGLVIDHLCDVRCCINPDHLEAVTNGENISRTYKRGKKTHWRKQQTHCKRGHEFTEENTRKSNGRRHCRECSRMRKRGELING
jgi:hypothetical protein